MDSFATWDRRQMDADPRTSRPFQPDFPRMVGSPRQGIKMSVSVLSRQNILDRIRAATRCVSKDPQQLPDSYAALRRDYPRHGSLSSTACIELMVERLRDYDAEVIESTKELLPAA